MKFEERLEKEALFKEEDRHIKELDKAEKVIYFLKKFFKKELLYLLEAVKKVFVMGDEDIDLYDSHDKEETGEIIFVGELKWDVQEAMVGACDETVKYKLLKIVLKQNDTIIIYGGKSEKPLLIENWHFFSCKQRIEDTIVGAIANGHHQYVDPNISEKTIIKEEKMLTGIVYEKK